MSEEVTYLNTRFDPDLTSFHSIAKQMAEGFGYTATLELDRQTAQLIRLRVAQMNPCSYCLILHTRAASDVGLSQAVIAHLPSWSESEMYADETKAALAYTEALTRHDPAAFPAVHEALKAFFTEKQIAEIAAVVINMNVWVRLKLAQGAVPVPQDE